MKLKTYAKSRVQLQIAKLLDKGTMSRQQIADRLGVAPGTVASAKRVMIKRAKKAAIPNNAVIGIIGDTHIPYEAKNYLSFCAETFAKAGVTRVIHIGDLIDNHSLSFHDSEPGLRGSKGEYMHACQKLEPWYKAFPELTLIYGNHDAIPARQMKKVGLDPDLYMQPMEVVYQMPSGWSVQSELEIDGVLYHHGHTACGVNGFRNDSKARFQSTVTGHAHGNSGVSYTATRRELVYGCAVGCGIDNSSMAFAYGKNFAQKPIVSCAVVSEGGTLPQVTPMPLKWLK